MKSYCKCGGEVKDWVCIKCGQHYAPFFTIPRRK
jgi:hypothetical protein